MTLQKTNTRTIVLILMIVVAMAFRLLSYKFQVLSNFTPVGAIALFGGAYFADKWKAYAVVLLALFLSNIAINYLYTSKILLWTSSSVWMYLTFAIMVFVGSLIKKANFLNVLLASIAGICIHWLIMDLPFLYGTMYPHTLAGYGQSLLAAIPFERNMVYGDAVFGTLLFGGFELAKRKYSALAYQPNNNGALRAA
ncbi:hypothetical protein BDD43_5050 [Mucilaginibacter gracilis]|uniref:Uncharacterized protein n=1 Tax=Mucilaginibacter gracilis TaxID=423350 RepID=A0A495J7D6_9SPHI|nr:DUF6580 family putative transport protein [Mucilaginibacter gracilis]RKR84797.1 hypothetical protein BDD43_5050 [Mucilaginibacter gracilis]